MTTYIINFARKHRFITLYSLIALLVAFILIVFGYIPRKNARSQFFKNDQLPHLKIVNHWQKSGDVVIQIRKDQKSTTEDIIKTLDLGYGIFMDNQINQIHSITNHRLKNPYTVVYGGMSKSGASITMIEYEDFLFLKASYN